MLKPIVAHIKRYRIVIFTSRRSHKDCLLFGYKNNLESQLSCVYYTAKFLNYIQLLLLFDRVNFPYWSLGSFLIFFFSSPFRSLMFQWNKYKKKIKKALEEYFVAGSFLQVFCLMNIMYGRLIERMKQVAC